MWQLSPRLTISAGLRSDFIKRRDNVFTVVTQDSIAIGPRLGLNYALTPAGHDVVRATWGRMHDVLSSNAASAGSATSGFRDLYDLDLNGTFETTFATPGSTALSRNRVIDLDRWNQPFVDEFTLGHRRQWPGGVSTDLSLSRRGYRERTALVDVNGIYSGSVFQGYRDESQNEIYLVTNNIWNWPVVTSVDVALTKQTTPLTVVAAYSRQWRYLAGTWQPNDPASFLQPGAFRDDRGIGSPRSPTSTPRDSNSLSGTALIQRNGPASQWQDHVVHLAAAYTAAWGLEVGVSYTYQSGAWVGPVITRISGPDPQFGPTTVRLSNGRVVSNPLATSLRFAFPTRSDGQFTLPAYQALSLRVARRFRMAKAAVEVGAESFNLTNADADLVMLDGANQTFSPDYQKGASRQVPRSAQVFARFSF
jgi:hypothetical protein